MAVCEVCFRHCKLNEGQTGACGARVCSGGIIKAGNYGRITSIALDPIEKKPLARFFPGSKILSVGSYGCNLFCPFCQNYDISRSDGRESGEEILPEQLAQIALKYKDRGNIGIAYTYNEPLIGFEFVRDTAKLVKSMGMKNVLVTNGMAELPVLEELLPYMDAMNIDLKGFRPEIYRYLGGDFETVKAFISRAAEACHVELTSLIVPGMNDDPEDMEREAAWIASVDPEIPLHITRYFPRYKMRKGATDISLLKDLKRVAERHLAKVLLGNV